jgi:predicted dehydrogenase
MLATEHLDLLIVATPPHYHEANCMAAIDAKVRGILCEKPFTGTAAGAERIARAARGRDVPVVVNFSRRWDASHRALASKIQRAELGDPRYAAGCYTGTLRGNGSHLLDTLRMLWPDEWRVDWATPLPGGDADDGPIAAELVSSSGARAALFPIVNADYFVFELQLFASGGRTRITAQGNDIRLDGPAPHPDYPGYRYLSETEALPQDTLPDSFAHALAALSAAVRTGQPLVTTPEQIVGSLDLLEAIVNVARKGRS